MSTDKKSIEEGLAWIEEAIDSELYEDFGDMDKLCAVQEVLSILVDLKGK